MVRRGSGKTVVEEREKKVPLFALLAGAMLAIGFGELMPAQDFRGELRIDEGDHPRLLMLLRGVGGGNSFPLTELPATLDSSGDEVRLFPDLGQARKRKVPVYLINGTDRPYAVESLAFELPIVLEAHLGDGHWERAEPMESVGFLHSSKTEELPPGHFRMKEAGFWTEGEPAWLRYALYQEGRAVLTSSPFRGKLPIGEVDRARYDLMSAAMVPEALQIRYRAGQTNLDEVTSEWPAKLELLRVLGPCHVDLRQVQDWTGHVHENTVSTRRERDAAVALQMRLLQPWPGHYDRVRLHQGCERMLREDGNSPQVRALCWQVIGEYLRDHHPVSHLETAALAERAWNLLFDDVPPVERQAAADFLCVPAIAEHHCPVTDPGIFGGLIGHPVPQVRTVAANFVMSQGRSDAVLDWYRREIDRIEAAELVRILHFDRRHDPYGRPDWDLWKKALEKDLEYSLPMLSLLFESDPRQTDLRKFAESSALPPGIRLLLERYGEGTPNTPSRTRARRLLDNVAPDRNQFFIERKPHF